MRAMNSDSTIRGHICCTSCRVGKGWEESTHLEVVTEGLSEQRAEY